VAEPKKPMSTWPASLASSSGSMTTGLPAIALSAVTSAWPSDVPPSLDNRSMDRRTSTWALVGVWTTTAPSPKATIPTFTSGGWRSTKALAAALAASMRVGLMSSALMLLEMSTARITVPSRLGVFTVAMGWAIPTMSRVRAAANSPKGTWRRARIFDGAAATTRPCAARVADRCARRRRDRT
jgi:hypothetical protein